jgi:osmotically-inducible protein OsmY
MIIVLMVCLICLSNKNVIAKSITDNQITSAIETEFLLNDSVNYNTIDVITSDGIVTLSGSADNILAKERAETLAQSILGVRSIVNLIRVTPADKRTDQEISTDVQLALLDDPAADAYEIEVGVTDGVVTLKGTEIPGRKGNFQKRLPRELRELSR